MNFLNGALLFGAAAFAVPLIIHILNRSRFRTIRWGAMHLLDSLVRVNQRRFRLEQLILLLVRCAIPVMLALCLARPLLTGWRDLEGDAPVSVVVLLDTSYSMDAVTDKGRHLDLAIAEATTILQQMNAASQVAVIQTGGRPTPIFDQPIFDPSLLVEQLRSQAGGYGASQMLESVELALATLSGMSHARRELIVISDFQAADWPTAKGSLIEEVQRLVAEADIPPVATLIRVGNECFGNVSVDEIQLSSTAIGVGQNVLARVKVRNHAATPYERARLTLLLDGVEREVSDIDIAEQGTTQAVFTCQFETAGSHVVTVELSVDDPLATDNRLSSSVNVWEKVDVLLVDGAPSSDPLRGETDFLNAALTPFTLGRLSLTDLMVTRTIAPDQLTATELSQSQVVVLANVGELPPQQVEELAAYVRGGGGLLVFAGDRLNTNWYNEHLWEGEGLLPAAWAATTSAAANDGLGDNPGSESGNDSGSSENSSVATRIVAQHFDHAALELFNDPANGDLSAAEFRRWYRFAAIPDGTAVLARLGSGDPFLLERRVGDGVVVQAATPCDADWSDLPLRPVFVPLMQQLVAGVASQISPPRNIATGEPILAVFRGQHGGVPLSVTTPSGARTAVAIEQRADRGVVRFVDTQLPGVYTLVGPDAKPLHFVAQSSRDESELQVLTDEQFSDVAEVLQAESFRTASEYLRRDHRWRHGREIWRILWGLVLALLFLELFLQQSFTRARA